MDWADGGMGEGDEVGFWWIVAYGTMSTKDYANIAEVTFDEVTVNIISSILRIGRCEPDYTYRTVSLKVVRVINHFKSTVFMDKFLETFLPFSEHLRSLCLCFFGQLFPLKLNNFV